MNKLTFGMALAALREGKKVRLPHWSVGNYLKEITFNGFEPSLVEYAYDSTTGEHRGWPGAEIDYSSLCSNEWEVTEGLLN